MLGSLAVNIEKLKLRIFLLVAVLTALSVWAAILLEEPLILGAPVALLLAYQTLVNYKVLFILLFASIPISTEIYFSNGLATDLPTEPLIVGLMLVYLLQAVSRPDKLDSRFLFHPLSLLILGHFVWIAFTTILSADMGVSLKFMAAKFWYLITFYFLAGHIIRHEKAAWNLMWWVAIPLALATSKVILHHATLNFGFKEVNEATGPFFRNHVTYAAVNALLLPILACFLWVQKRWSLRWWILLGCTSVVFLGMLTAYTRAAYVALILAVGAFMVIRFKLVKWALLGAAIVVAGVFIYLANNNTFLRLAPTESTIAHEEFGDIVAATYTLEDVSTSERYYRWIAGTRMVAERPLTGFGPGNFYFFYKGYTLNKFETYVSANPEKSGIHNYYLMILVEQGWLGFLIFVGIVFYTLVLGQRVYHQVRDRSKKLLIAGLLMVLIVIDSFLIMNDMIETDKVGSFFFFSMAVLVNLDIQSRKKNYNK